MSVSSQLPCESLASELYRIYHTAEIPHRKHIRFNKRPRRFNSGRSILCNGKAEFYDCEFLCNVAQTDSYITVSSSGKIHFNRCTFKKGFHSGLFLIGNTHDSYPRVRYRFFSCCKSLCTACCISGVRARPGNLSKPRHSGSFW